MDFGRLKIGELRPIAGRCLGAVQDQLTAGTRLPRADRARRLLFFPRRVAGARLQHTSQPSFQQAPNKVIASGAYPANANTLFYWGHYPCNRGANVHQPGPDKQVKHGTYCQQHGADSGW